MNNPLGPNIRWARLYEGIGADLTKPFGEAEHARNVEANYKRIAEEKARADALAALGVQPCPCCGDYHE